MDWFSIILASPIAVVVLLFVVGHVRIIIPEARERRWFDAHPVPVNADRAIGIVRILLEAQGEAPDEPVSAHRVDYCWDVSIRMDSRGCIAWSLEDMGVDARSGRVLPASGVRSRPARRSSRLVRVLCEHTGDPLALVLRDGRRCEVVDVGWVATVRGQADVVRLIGNTSTLDPDYPVFECDEREVVEVSRVADGTTLWTAKQRSGRRA